MQISIPYGKNHLSCDIPEDRLLTIMTPAATLDMKPAPQVLVRESMDHPIGTPPLWELAKGKAKVVVIASDHTRPVPSRVIMPEILADIRRGNPEADITILIATGCHRGTTVEELRAKFGDEIVDREKIVVHDCEDTQNLIRIGTLPSGGELTVNRLAVEADLLVSEGFIEPHFFAGFSGGRKSVLPGIASRVCVHYNHNAEFIDDPNARMGILDGNPIHRDMIYAARKANLAYIVNVVLDASGRVISSYAGDMEQAHRLGCEYVASTMKRDPVPADIVITSNNGYPLDQNLYQMVKGMYTAQFTCKPGGVIIAVGECSDGIGGASFARMLESAPDMDTLLARIRDTKKEETVTDQWQVQILARILQHAHVILVSALPADTVRALRMIPAESLEDALCQASSLLGRSDASITVIPEGISVIL